MPGYDDDLRLAHVLADAVERITMARFRAEDLVVESKPDLTLVSDADKAAEELVRHPAQAHPAARRRRGRGVRDHRPRPAPLGHRPDRRHPQLRARCARLGDADLAWSTTSMPVLGLVAAPALGRRWWAAIGSGAWSGRSLTSAKRIHVSRSSRIEDASLSYSSLKGWRERRPHDEFLALTDACWRTRAYGDFWSYMLVAEGAVDIAAEPELAVYDMAALVPIVTEAGGRFTSLAGKDGPWGGNARRHQRPAARRGARAHRHRTGTDRLTRAPGSGDVSRGRPSRLRCPARARRRHTRWRRRRRRRSTPRATHRGRPRSSASLSRSRMACEVLGGERRW